MNKIIAIGLLAKRKSNKQSNQLTTITLTTTIVTCCSCMLPACRCHRPPLLTYTLLPGMPPPKNMLKISSAVMSPWKQKTLDLVPNRQHLDKNVN